MLHLTALHLENFGPFKGKQKVDISTKDGVTVVYGENMRGKTSLLNAIRFAFFGKVLGRGAKALALQKVGNWEEAALGRFGFQVQLEFRDENHVYKLTRSCHPRRGVTVPRSDDDYEIEYFLDRDGSVLGPKQAELEINRLLPEQISRFFLFDGELLQEYEDLLSSEPDMGRKISEAIERILGVPVLTSARSTLLQLKERSDNREAIAAQGDQKTLEFGNHLASLYANRLVLNEDLQRHMSDLEAMRAQKALLEEAMKKKERVAVLLEKKDTLVLLVKEIETKRVAKYGELQLAMSEAWSSVLAHPISQAMATLRSLERSLQAETMRAEVLRSLQLDAKSECPACLQSISSEARSRIEAAVHSSGGTQSNQAHELAAVRRKVAALEQYGGAGRLENIRLRWDAVEESTVDQSAKKDELEEIVKQLENVDEEALRKTKTDLESANKQIDALDRGITKTIEALDENKADSEGIRKRLDKLAGADLAGARKRRQMFADLHRLFDEAVSVYREQLRKRVESDATRHFLSLTTEPDYKALRINDSYGLTIVHNDGSDIPVRSAGAEHVVALSLVGALQNNAPLRGPIVIDSPFGRLDREHTRNIIRALPSMAKQVILLVYEEELPPALARQELKGQLRGEWRLERRTAKHTELVERGD